MSAPELHRDGVPIHHLPAVVAHVIERAGGVAPAKLAITYLRVKPGRGLAAVYRTVPRADRPADQPPLIYLSVDEAGLAGVQTSILPRIPRGAAVEGSWPGVVSIPAMGIVLQSFPTDLRLPRLAAACDLVPGSPAFVALEAAAVELESDSAVRLQSASVMPLRYKPGDRCVVRYRLELRAGSRRAERTVIGKVYRDPLEAERVHRLLDTMHHEQLAQTGEIIAGVRVTSPLVPRPVAIALDLGLTLNEDVRSPGEAVVTGSEALGRRRGGAAIPERRLAAAAVALARVHMCSVHVEQDAVRTPGFEASRALARARRLGDFAPWIADRALTIARTLEDRMRQTDGAVLPAHGSFKPAQLLFRGHNEVVVTDFDQFCRAEPALDVGYFLAYLRPSSLWYRRAGARDWFSQSALAFTEAYRAAAIALGADPGAADCALGRAPLYESALLFKIANRRPNRLNSVRPRELEAMLAEADACVAGAVA